MENIENFTFVSISPQKDFIFLCLPCI